MADPTSSDLTPRSRGAIHDRIRAYPPRWGFWKGVLTGAVIEVPAIAGALWLAAAAGLADADVGFMRTIRLTAVFAGIAAVLTAGGIGRLAAHASVDDRDGRGGRLHAAWVAGRAHAVASAGLIVIAAIPGGGLPARGIGWVELAALGALAGLVCGAMIGLVCSGAAPVGLGDVMALAKRPSDALRQLIDPEDLVRLGARVRVTTTNLFDGMFEPGPRRPSTAPVVAAAKSAAVTETTATPATSTVLSPSPSASTVSTTLTTTTTPTSTLVDPAEPPNADDPPA